MVDTHGFFQTANFFRNACIPLISWAGHPPPPTKHLRLAAGEPSGSLVVAVVAWGRLPHLPPTPEQSWGKGSGGHLVLVGDAGDVALVELAAGP